jgi:hypothetical protein
MDLKNVNPNGDNVVASNLINVNFYFYFENCENWVHHMLFFLKDAMVVQ